MQGHNRTLVNPSVSYRDEVAKIDARKSAEVEAGASAEEIVASHTGRHEYIQTTTRIVREGLNGTGNELHIDVLEDGLISLWAKEPVFWFAAEEIPALISQLTGAAAEAASRA